MFLWVIQWQMSLYQRQIMCGCFCWAWPRFFCCFAALATKRKSGWGICGSSCFVMMVLLLIDLPFYWCWPTALCTIFLTAYVSFRTVPQCIYGQSRGKKNDSKPALTCFALISMVLRHWSSRLALRPASNFVSSYNFVLVCCNFHNLEASRLALRPSLCANCGLSSSEAPTTSSSALLGLQQ